MLIRANMQLVGLDIIDKALSIDSKTLSTNCKAFIEKNRLLYYVAINTWSFLIKEYSQYGWINLIQRIATKGLVPTIKCANDAATEIIEEKEITDSLFRHIYQDVRQPHYGWGFPRNAKEVGNDPEATMLQLLRFLKRISPLEADQVKDASITDFISVENRTKLLQRREHPDYILRYVREVVATYMDWESLCDDIEHDLSHHMYSYSQGACRNGVNSLGKKFMNTLSEYPEAIHQPFGLPYLHSELRGEVLYWYNSDNNPLAGTTDPMRIVTVNAVPKSYKAARIIAMEDNVRQSLANNVGKIIDRYLPSTVPLHDQTVNQDLAWIGSVDGSVATADLSHASDCISKTLFWEVFPPRFAKLIYPLLGTHYDVGGKIRLMQQMSTAGNSLTFILESMMFDIISRTVIQILKNWGVEVPSRLQVKDRVLNLPSIYGDDIAIQTEAFATLVEVLECLGFIVNESKSYAVGPYRESCGAEYLQGTDVSSFYFPRFPIEGKITEKRIDFSKHAIRDSRYDVWVDSLSSMIDLQHRLYYVCYPAARFLAELVKESFPKMTTSPAGTISSDLWDYEEDHRIFKYPFGHIEVSPRKVGDVTLRWAPPTRLMVTARVDLPEWPKRAGYSPKPVYKLSKPLTPNDWRQRATNLYNYNQFLKYGPRYEDPLLELLGISSPPVSVERLFGEMTISWSLTEVK